MSEISAVEAAVMTDDSSAMYTEPKYIKRVIYRGFHPSVTREAICDFFSVAGKVSHIIMLNHICAGHGAVAYSSVEEAKKAEELLDYSVVGGKLIRVSFPQMDDDVQYTYGCKKLSIKNLDEWLSEEDIRGVFEKFGTIVSWEQITKRDRTVEYEREEAAREAMEGLDEMIIGTKQVSVKPFIPESTESDREEERREILRTTVVLRNLSQYVSDLLTRFLKFGFVIGASLDMDEDDHFLGSGYVTFENVQDAAVAIEKMNGYENWIVEWALGDSEQGKIRKLEQVEDANILVENLHEFVSDENLKEMFTPFGWVKSCKVTPDSQGGKTGGVEFRTREDAARAVNGMNGKVIVGKRLSVAFVETRNEKKPKLEEVDVMPASA